MFLVSRKCSGFTLIELMIVIAIISILSSILAPNFVRVRAQGHLIACKSNLKNIATCCELYAIDHDGRYPQSLSVLTEVSMGGYLKQIPTCPEVGSDTYSGNYVSQANPDMYTIFCAGLNHTAVGLEENMPLFDSVHGLCTTEEEAHRG